MELPDNIRYLLEALRGGGQSRFVNGKMVEHSYGPPKGDGINPMMKALNNNVNYSRYMMQTKAMGEQPLSYEEWMYSR